MELTFKDDVNHKIIVSDNVFNCTFNEGLIHQVVRSYSLSNRQGSRAQKNRSEVSGSGKKPWRQKGTGRARVGSIRSPLWRSGGVTFAAKPKNYFKKVNKKMYRGALKSILSELIRQNRLLIFKNFVVDNHKTKNLVSKLREIQLNKVLIIINSLDKNLYLASKNLYHVIVQDVRYINPISCIKFKNVICTYSALKKIEEILT